MFAAIDQATEAPHFMGIERSLDNHHRAREDRGRNVIVGISVSIVAMPGFASTTIKPSTLLFSMDSLYVPESR
jgi:hypothetical protein